MMYHGITTRLSELYLQIQALCLLHPLRTDAAVLIAVSYILMIVLRHRNRRRHKLYRLLWGSYMKRADRERFHMKLFEDAIVDTAMDAVHRGDMSIREEADFYKLFAKKCGMAGLNPRRNVIQGVRSRLKKLYNNKPNIPGKPEVSVDKTYKIKTTSGLKSRYLTED